MIWTTCLLMPALLMPQGGKPDPKKSAAKPPAEQRMFRPMPLPGTIAQFRGARKIDIDGALSDWPKAVPIEMQDPRQVSGTSLGAYRGPNDISGQVYMVWDETNLFVAIQVIDDWHRDLKKNVPLRQEIPPADNVIITFDPKRDTVEMGSDPGRQEDRTFLFADMEETAGQLILWDRLRGSKTLAPGAACVVTRRAKEGVTIYEARIPWPMILPAGAKPVAGYTLDMQVVINDYDEPGDRLPQTRVGWNFGMGPKINPGLWGSVMLLKEFDAKRDKAPAFPRAPKPSHKLVTREAWLGLYRGIHKTSPTFVTGTTADPAAAGGEARHKLLVEFDRHLEDYPRLDNLNYHHRIQRRMSRENAGLGQSGLPFFWNYALTDMARRIKTPPDGKAIRLFRLPQGGWYVRSATCNFVIDPCGFGIEKLYMQRGVDFALLTRPAEPTRRHDPLLIRMVASKPKRQFFTHLEFHLRGSVPGSMFRVKPFVEYLMGGLESIQAIGRVSDDGKVTLSYGYLVKWKDGPTLLVAGLSITPAEIEKIGLRPDVLIVSGAHQDAIPIARAVNARYTVIEDVFVAAEYPAEFGGRYTYDKALRLQSDMKPLRTVILAPGESIDFK
jgi:hypothetical protein